MTALIVLLILIPILIIILLVSINNKVSASQEIIEQLKDRITKLSIQLSELKQDKKEEPKPEVKPIVVPKPIVVEKPVIIPVKEEIDERKLTEVPKPIIKKNKDLEKFIGENLANKIGIAVLVLGISFFVKYAIDKNWINEVGRVVIGLVSGGILIGLAHYIRNNYRSFSSVLIGGGLTVFYFTIAFAFQQYSLLSQQAAFIIMVIISAFAVLLSLYYQRQELAILATIGGFVTPFLVSTGQENYIALFTYLCILNTGLMVLSWFKRWPAINIIGLFFTTIIYGGWLIKRTIFDSSALPYQDAFIFATIFYLLFIAMNIVNNLRLRQSFKAFDFIIGLSTNFLYYFAGMVIISYQFENSKGIFTLSLGAFNFILATIFYRKKSIDANFISLLIGLTLTYFSLTPLIEFEGNSVVLFWAAETVILFWLYQRTRIIHLKIASVFVAVFLILGLIFNWIVFYGFDTIITSVIINQRFITMLFVSVSLFIYYALLKKEKETYFLTNITLKYFKDLVLIFAFVIGYAAGAWEICYQFISRYHGSEVFSVYLQAYSFAVAIVVMQLRKHTAHYTKLKFVLTGLSLALYLFYLTFTYRTSIELVTSNNKVLFMGHWVAAALLLWLLYDLVRYVFTTGLQRDTYTSLAAISMIFVLSVELYHAIVWTQYSNGNDWEWWENLYYKAGLSILWSICSFIMIWLGMKLNFRTLRVISLSLFTITLIKLFLYDIRNIPPGGKIAAFILLGILLLTVSFMYQRLKKILIDNAGK